jgi:hypothetical protein
MMRGKNGLRRRKKTCVWEALAKQVNSELKGRKGL